jgi:hypothetical protein
MHATEVEVPAGAPAGQAYFWSVRTVGRPDPGPRAGPASPPCRRSRRRRARSCAASPSPRRVATGAPPGGRRLSLGLLVEAEEDFGPRASGGASRCRPGGSREGPSSNS